MEIMNLIKKIDVQVNIGKNFLFSYDEYHEDYLIETIDPDFYNSTFNSFFGYVIKRARTLAHLTVENKNIQYNSFEMDIQKGVGIVDDPEITLELYKV